MATKCWRAVRKAANRSVVIQVDEILYVDALPRILATTRMGFPNSLEIGYQGDHKVRLLV